MPIIEIDSLAHEGVEVFSTLTEAQLRNKVEPEKGMFIAESPKVLERALDAGYEPLCMLVEEKQITEEAAEYKVILSNVRSFSSPGATSIVIE